ncbi:MAG: SCP2 sterol-binding domain-containing protein [Myxococcales bacterium]|nr:SCP2 sterol-binding domain-containing protein [Myxococcales bacterium]MCB9755196.1 SCP2 sterol-binding domain-containing protein [Myxococcales bacterium]
MSLEDYTSKVRGMVGDDSGLGKTLKFDLGDEGVILIDGKSTPNTVSNDNVDADCTVKLSSENFGNLLAGKGNPMTMFMTGKIKVSGDMGVAMKLQSLFKK